MPSISVIVPVYQAGACLKKCVESMIQQTFSDWELLLIDDGSTDGSPAFCDKYAAGDDRIRVFHKANGGVSSARNLGLKEAKGQYIAFLDADDRYEFRALETLWCLREQTGADTVGCAHLNLSMKDNTPNSVELLLKPGVYDAQEIKENIVYPLLGDRLRAPVFNGFVWRYLFSADILRAANITFEGAYLEDELFLMEYFCNAQKLAVTDQALYRYYLNPTSATHRYMKDFMQVFTRFMERKEELVKRYQLESARPQWRENSYWAGLLIAVSNEFAPGVRISLQARRQNVKNICQRPEMANVIKTYTPSGLSANKQLVAKLIKERHFFALSQMYRVKNRI